MNKWIELIKKTSEFYHKNPDLVDAVVSSDQSLKELVEADELKKIKEQKETLETLKDTNQELSEDNQLLESKITDLEAKLQEYEIPEKGKYWNNKYQKKNILYRRPLLGGENEYIDVRLFIQPKNCAIENRIDENNLNVDDPLKINDIVPEIYEEAQQDYDYSYDSKSLGKSEYWLFPWETMARGTGDCEDHACKIISFLRAAGVPAWRIRNVCGMVNSGAGGHSTVYVLADDLETWYHINSTSTKFHDNLTDYPEWGDKSDGIGIDPSEVWFTFNDKYAWQEFESSTSKDHFNKNKINDDIKVE